MIMHHRGTFYKILSMFLLHFEICNKKRFKIISRFKKSEDHGPETTKVSIKMEVGVKLKIDVGSIEIIFSSL